MTQSDRFIQRDRMRFTKDSRSSGLVLLAIVFNVLYFVSIYQSDVGSYFYNYKIGLSIVYNLLFLLIAFLASQGVKSRKTGYSTTLTVLGVMQIVRIFYMPAQAVSTMVAIGSEEVPAMTKGQYTYVVICLVISAVCCLAAAVMSYINNQRLAQHMNELANQTK